MTLVLKPADILVVRTTDTPGEVIRVVEELSGAPGLGNHVAFMHHWDGDVPWGLEGKPGGVGWRDLRDYLADPFTLNNCLQPGRPDADRALAARDAEGLLGTKYDWAAILGDGFDDLSVKIWNQDWPHGKPPGEVVCSSFGAYVYAKRTWTHPDLGHERFCQPSGWTRMIIANRWHAA
jgi:hypothetical protein